MKPYTLVIPTRDDEIGLVSPVVFNGIEIAQPPRAIQRYLGADRTAHEPAWAPDWTLLAFDQGAEAYPHTALVLQWDGRIVHSGWDHLRRVYRQNVPAGEGRAEAELTNPELIDIIMLAMDMASAGLTGHALGAGPIVARARTTPTPPAARLGKP